MPETLEERVRNLEREVAQLRQREQSAPQTGREWVDDLYGKFKNDPIFAEAMELGRKYRQSLRPRSKKAKSKK